MREMLRFFVHLFDRQVLLVASLGVAATLLCLQSGIHADLPSSLVAVAIVFPIVFSISAAYQRREDALKSLGVLRAGIASIYFAHRDWVSDGGEGAARARELGRQLYAAICSVLTASSAGRRES